MRQETAQYRQIVKLELAASRVVRNWLAFAARAPTGTRKGMQISSTPKWNQ
jgi:hypothetical protein